MADFIPGQELCRAFYEDVVAPLVQVPHSAGLLGPGSDVLGYDTERSTDHDWGPRCTVLVTGPELITGSDSVTESAVGEVRERVVTGLPERYRGWPVRIGRDGRPLEPHVVVATLPSWLGGQLGWEPGPRGPTVADWLLMPQQRLLGITGGAVFADHDGELANIRHRLAWYPDAVWWWLLACQWRRLAQEEPFVHRAAEVGDDLGSRVLAGRLARDCMRLALLIARRYAPYSKWLGTAFARLPDADGLGASLAAVMNASALPDRERALGDAYQLLGHRFNALTPHPAVDTALRGFFERPARIIGADRFVAAARDRVSDRTLADLPLIGSVDQSLDSADFLASPELVAAMRAFYRTAGLV